MQLINATRMVAGFNIGQAPDGQELLVVVVKGTFTLPSPGEEIRLDEAQLPLVTAHTFTGAPGASAPLYETDFAPRKHRCDVLLVGSAHAPQGQQITRMRVDLRVGTMAKSFDVVGDRVWHTGLTGISASEPQPFARMPLSYDIAFGGTDRHSPDPCEHGVYPPNPVGRGWLKNPNTSWVVGLPLPNTEEIGKPVQSPDGEYTPMALGPVGRGWPQRARHAGTYDKPWLDDTFPFLPKDFDEAYYQAAPEDQQIALPQGPLDVLLSGFMPDGSRQFTLPHFEAPVQVCPRSGRREDHAATLDTIVFEPDQNRFTMAWRMVRPLNQGIHEIAQVFTGRQKLRPGNLTRLSAATPAAASKPQAPA